MLNKHIFDVFILERDDYFVVAPTKKTTVKILPNKDQYYIYQQLKYFVLI